MGSRLQILRRGPVHLQLLGMKAPQVLLQKSPLAGRTGLQSNPQASLFLVEGGPHHLFLWEALAPIPAPRLPELVMLQAVGASESPGIRRWKHGLATRGRPQPTHGDSKAQRRAGRQIRAGSPVWASGVGAAQPMLFGKTPPILPGWGSCRPSAADRGRKGLLPLTGQGLKLGNPTETVRERLRQRQTE